MLKIRRSTFESNSSSSHTLVKVTTLDQRKYLKKFSGWNTNPSFKDVPNGYIKLSEDVVYGSGTPYILESPTDKASYLITYFAQTGYPAEPETPDDIPYYQEIYNELTKINPKFKGWKKQKPYIEWWEDENGIRHYHEEEAEYPWGYIDTESIGLFNDMLPEEVISIINDPDRVLLIGSDDAVDRVLQPAYQQNLFSADDFIGYTADYDCY